MPLPSIPPPSRRGIGSGGFHLKPFRVGVPRPKRPGEGVELGVGLELGLGGWVSEWNFYAGAESVGVTPLGISVHKSLNRG